MTLVTLTVTNQKVRDWTPTLANVSPPVKSKSAHSAIILNPGLANVSKVVNSLAVTTTGTAKTKQHANVIQPVT